MSTSLLSRLKKISCFAIDIDGVLTNNNILITPDDVLRYNNVKDGIIIKHAISVGYEVAIISVSNSQIMANRWSHLGVKNVFIEPLPKKDTLLLLSKKTNTALENIAFIGDDILDIEAMKIVGLAACPLDASPEVKLVSHYISICNGGRGAVRDVMQLVLQLRGDWNFN